MSAADHPDTHPVATSQSARRIPAYALAMGNWRRFGGPLGVLGILVGFFVIADSWFESGNTPDIRVQMQDLISAVGGLGLVLAGAILLVGDVFAGMRNNLRPQLHAIATALDGLADAATVATPAALGETVVGSRASYHRLSCDLVAVRSGLPSMTVAEADAAGLKPCRVCMKAGR